MAALELTAIFLVGWQGWHFIPQHFLGAWCVVMTGLLTLRLVLAGFSAHGSLGPLAATRGRSPAYFVMGLNLGWAALVVYFIFAGRAAAFLGVTPAFLALVLCLVLTHRTFQEINRQVRHLSAFCLQAALPFAIFLMIGGGVEARASAVALVGFCWAARQIVTLFHAEAARDEDLEANYREARREAGSLAFLVASTEETLRAVMDNLSCGFAICDKEMRFTAWNDAFLQLMEVPARWMSESRSYFDLAALQGGQKGKGQGDLSGLRRACQAQFAAVLENGVVETEIRRPDGVIYHNRRVRLPGGRVMFIYTDVTEARQLTAEAVARLSHHDPLTGLANRAKFRRELEKALHQSRSAKTMVSVILLNLDGFKDINETIGQAGGDELLCMMARRFESCARKSDVVARLGGDEFALIGSGHQSVDEAVLIAKRLLKSVAVRVELKDGPVTISASIGIASFPDDDARADRLMRNAEIALFRAKQEGRGHYRLYDQGMYHEIRVRAGLERDLRAAFENNHIVYHYQPQIDLATGQVVGVEALMRWHHPERGWVPPDQFITLAEKTGLIIPITENLLPGAGALACRLQSHGFKPLTMAINLSPVHFRSDGILNVISKILADSGLKPELLELEITEGTVMQDSEQVIQTMMQLDRLGVKLAIDDFGTGYSSLSYLKKFPVDKLKIDQSFVREVPHDPGASAIVEAVIKLGRSFNLKVIAEGVETKEQIEFLTAGGCDEVQGYYYSKAMPEEELILWLEDWHIIEPSREKAAG